MAMTTGSTKGAVKAGPTEMRERILEAAAELLGRFTLTKVTMEDVARATGIARQTIYKYFGGKDELVIALFVQEMTENHHPVLRKLAQRKPSKRNLRDLFLRELQIGKGYALMNGVLDPSIAPRIAELTMAAPAYIECREAVWVPILEQYRDAGVLRPDLDPKRIVRWFSYQEFWFLTHPDVLADDDATLLRYIEDFIIAAIVHEDC